MHFEDFADFEQRMMHPTFADHRVDDAKLAAVHPVSEPDVGNDGAPFTLPLHARLLCRLA